MGKGKQSVGEMPPVVERLAKSLISDNAFMSSLMSQVKAHTQAGETLVWRSENNGAAHIDKLVWEKGE